ncbi:MULTISPECIES: hypothetical protein [unclassified Clostridium]|uniref:hypothetical protein n=1 Tax=Clostridium TaxID=1485 RepID=UPI001C8B9001|nr:MULTISPECIES: hypothetical protein [unclassified Clostridium]MBX9136805.1 hypothetical protein [Clostridium sp. K12(2020)]MBX9143615.1 hypothetical protein [Clostridium sp. K13]MDU2289626.1 hypothetical protein [Clostridium celatum]
MTKFTTTYIIGVIGIVTWALTIFLRGTQLSTVNSIAFILGVMPNISATWLFIWIAEFICEKLSKVFTFKISIISCGAILILAFISEIVHDLFLNSPFDVNDMIATICAIAVYFIVIKVTTSKVMNYK